MFWSKIWLFVVAVAAAAALTVALVLPRPAQRVMLEEEHRRLTVACGVVGILLSDDARNRVDLAGSFARAPEIVGALEAASNAASLDDGRMRTVRAVGDTVMKTIQGTRKPDFAMLIDRKGRVVARVRLDDNEFGDVAAGRPLVDDALAGYLRDDLWAQNGTMYFVTASPVIKRDPPVEYAGAVVLGHQVTNELAKKLVDSLDVDVGFYLGDSPVAGSRTIALDQAALGAAVGKLAGGEPARDCQAGKPLELRAGSEDHTAVVARLPGEAAARGAFYSVFIKRPVELGFMGTLDVVTRSDLGLTSFPWILVAGLFVAMLGAGIGLMLVEADRPLRRLTADAVRLAKGDRERLAEDAHPGKFGSIARSVNIHIDKLGRDAKSARKDFDQLLGPAPEGSLGTIDLLATPLPSARPGGPAPAVPPPPSEFRFSDPAGTPPPRNTPLPMPAAPMPPPLRHGPGLAPPPPPPSPYGSQPSSPYGSQPSSPISLDDDILGGLGLAPSPEPGSRSDPYFKQVFDQFIAMKKSCSESIAGLTFEKFSEKLIKNRDDLMSKTGCREVRFTVYVKDGKAALKATPVKTE